MFTVYSKPNCTFCDKAKSLLALKGLAFREIHFDVGQSKVDGAEYVNVAEFKVNNPQAKTAPQIFVEERGALVYVGGFTELQARLS